MVTSFFYMPHADTRLIHAVLKKITAADSEREYNDTRTSWTCIS